MIPRIISAILGIPVLVLIIGFGEPWHFFLLVAGVTAVALWEYFTMISAGVAARTLGSLSGILAFFGGMRWGASLGASLAAILLLGALSLRIALGRTKRDTGRCLLTWSLIGILYVGYLFSHWWFLYETPGGRQWVFFILLVIMTGDTAGYLVGRRFGRRKIYPRISPNKTLEGTLGVLAAGVLAGMLAKPLLLPDLSPQEAFGLSLGLSALGQGGDLFESWIKRSFSVKDSGVLIPGHGGILDRMDSLIFPAVVAAHYAGCFHS